jgi:hypothetical protein
LIGILSFINSEKYISGNYIINYTPKGVLVLIEKEHKKLRKLHSKSIKENDIFTKFFKLLLFLR